MKQSLFLFHLFLSGLLYATSFGSSSAFWGFFILWNFDFKTCLLHLLNNVDWEALQRMNEILCQEASKAYIFFISGRLMMCSRVSTLCWVLIGGEMNLGLDSLSHTGDLDAGWENVQFLVFFGLMDTLIDLGAFALWFTLFDFPLVIIDLLKFMLFFEILDIDLRTGTTPVTSFICCLNIVFLWSRCFLYLWWRSGNLSLFFLGEFWRLYLVLPPGESSPSCSEIVSFTS